MYYTDGGYTGTRSRIGSTAMYHHDWGVEDETCGGVLAGSLVVTIKATTISLYPRFPSCEKCCDRLVGITIPPMAARSPPPPSIIRAPPDPENQGTGVWGSPPRGEVWRGDTQKPMEKATFSQGRCGSQCTASFNHI